MSEYNNGSVYLEQLNQIEMKLVPFSDPIYERGNLLLSKVITSLKKQFPERVGQLPAPLLIIVDSPNEVSHVDPVNFRNPEEGGGKRRRLEVRISKATIEKSEVYALSTIAHETAHLFQDTAKWGVNAFFRKPGDESSALSLYRKATKGERQLADQQAELISHLGGLPIEGIDQLPIGEANELFYLSTMLSNAIECQIEKKNSQCSMVQTEFAEIGSYRLVVGNLASESRAKLKLLLSTKISKFMSLTEHCLSGQKKPTWINFLNLGPVSYQSLIEKMNENQRRRFLSMKSRYEGFNGSWIEWIASETKRINSEFRSLAEKRDPKTLEAYTREVDSDMVANSVLSDIGKKPIDAAQELLEMVGPTIANECHIMRTEKEQPIFFATSDTHGLTCWRYQETERFVRSQPVNLKRKDQHPQPIAR